MKRTWKHCAAKAASRLLAAAVAVTTCLSGMVIPARAAGYGKDGIVRDMTSQQIVEDMGLGYNIGNTFDSIGSFITITDPWEYQRGWGNEPVSKHFIRKVKEGGFKTIRLPVSWAQWIDENHQINPGYMKAVETVVDWCMEEDLYVILNIHHDSGAADTSWVRRAATDWDWASARYEAVWTQIANHFKNYGDHLIFEGMNEVEFPDAVNMSRQYMLLNNMNQLFVDTVRKTGGNNEKRHLLIPGYNTDIKKTCDRRYQMPTDPANHCILSIHYYSPSPFCVAEHNVDWAVPVTTWGSEADIQAVEADLNILAEHYLSKGVPVIIGEYGVLTEDNKEKASIQAYVSRVPQIIMEYGMCPVLWDTSNAGDMKFIERVGGEFYDPVIKQNYQALAQKKTAGQITKRQFHYPTYKRRTVPVSPEGWVSIASYEPEKILGIAFELSSSKGWDSYGGGGIYIDSWDATINYEFSSVYDEVTHIFTPEERSRLKDQLSIAIWWTEETGGRRHRDELSIKGGQITLLYEDDGAASAVKTTSAGFKGGSGGGGGGSTGGSYRPNTSTTPAGGSQTVPDNDKNYEYILKDLVKDANGQVREAMEFDLAHVCPGYRIGDKVQITISCLSDGGYSMGLHTLGWKEQLSFDKTGSSLECTPEDGKVWFDVWYMGGKYFMFNLKAQIIEKAPETPVIEGFDIVSDQEYRHSLQEAYEINGAAPGKRVKLTVTGQATEDGRFADSEIWFTDVNGTKVMGDISSGSPTAILIGTPKNEELCFKLKEPARARSTGEAGDSLTEPTVHISNIKVEVLSEEALVAELQGGSRIEISGNSQTVRQEEGEEPGYKVYFEYEGDIRSDFSGVLVGQGWTGEAGSESWEIREDAQGARYIWYPSTSPSLMAACWSDGGHEFVITDVVRVKETAQESFTPFDITEDTADSPYEYDLTELKKKAGISQGEAVKITVSAEGTDEFKGEIFATDAKGNTVKAYLSDSGSEAAIAGIFSEESICIKVGDLTYGQGVYKPYTVAGIRVEKVSADEEVIGEFPGNAQEITFDLGHMRQEEAGETEEAGLKIYYDYEGGLAEVGAGIQVNGWDDPWSGEGWKNSLRSDDEGTYIWYPCENVEYVVINCYGCAKPWKIVDLVQVVKKEEPGEDFPIEITEDYTYTPYEYDLAGLKEKAGIEDGEAIKIIVSTEAMEGDGKFKGELSVTNTKGLTLTKSFYQEEPNPSISGFFENTISFRVNNTTNDWSNPTFKPYKITNIQVKKENLASEADNVIHEFQGDNTTIEFDLDVFLETDNSSTETESGLKIYYEFDGDVKNVSANIILNNNWYSLENVRTGSDGGEDYVWYPCTTADSLKIVCYYSATPWKVTKLVFVSPTSVRKTATRIAAAIYTRAQIEAVVSDDTILEWEAVPGEDGSYEVPEEISGSLTGVWGEVSSNEEVILILDGERRVKAVPVDGRFYYFCQGGAAFENICFEGQEVDNVTFLYKDQDQKPAKPEEKKKDDEKPPVTVTEQKKGTESEEKPKEETRPSEEETKPSEEVTEPSKEEVKPSEEETEPSKEEMKPSEEESEPPKEKVKPSEEETEASKEKVEPSEEETEISKEEVEPSEDGAGSPEEVITPPEEAGSWEEETRPWEDAADSPEEETETSGEGGI